MHIQAKLGQGDGSQDESDDTVLQTQDSHPGSVRSSTLPLGHGGSFQYIVLRMNGGETFCNASRNNLIAA